MEENKSSHKEFTFAVGRRKSSSAEARIYKKDVTIWNGKLVKVGEIFINGKPAIEYFGKNYEKMFNRPLLVTGNENKYALSIKVTGGGKMGQLEAAVLAVSRALDKINKEKHHAVLRENSLLTRDPRVRERRKVGMGGKSRRKKQSPKR
jgi:small subunit ribosomal protein S9